MKEKKIELKVVLGNKDSTFTTDSELKHKDSMMKKEIFHIEKNFDRDFGHTSKDVPAILALSIPIVFIICFAFLILIKLRLRHQERLKIIEKGGNLQDLENYPKYNFRSRGIIKNPFRLIGIGVGIFLGYVLDHFLDMGFVGYGGSILILMVLGSLIDYKYFHKNTLDDK